MIKLKIEDKIDGLKAWFSRQKKVIVALSGGVDSCLVAFFARKYLGPDRVIAVISHSASLKTRDLHDAKKFCENYDIPLEVIDAREIEDNNYASNPINRCYFCKSALYGELVKLISDKFKGYAILNGSNLGDFGDYRPGLQAADENSVLSPLADCALKKDDIRDIARHFDLFVWDKPASPCLSSRFPYGESITIQKLRMVEKAEDLLYDKGFIDCRVRYIDNSACIEVPHDQIVALREILHDLEGPLLEYGFFEVRIDQEGFVSGKLNRVLQNGK